MGNQDSEHKATGIRLGRVRLPSRPTDFILGLLIALVIIAGILVSGGEVGLLTPFGPVRLSVRGFKQDNSTTSSPPTKQASPATHLPRLEFQPVGAGGGDQQRKPGQAVAAGYYITNLESHDVELFVGTLDIDSRQNLVYPSARYLIPAGGSKLVTFLGWYEGACYTPLVLWASTEAVSQDLQEWFAQSGSVGRSQARLTASGEVHPYAIGAFCVSQNRG